MVGVFMSPLFRAILWRFCSSICSSTFVSPIYILRISCLRSSLLDDSLQSVAPPSNLFSPTSEAQQ
ncbi:hypothetical protein DL93DRAFT_2091759 [Clavulina sp. PMI_390]|nr:hypothetical protein DL93DRAFT_2091759 [Clavulina sp. PMI_390]